MINKKLFLIPVIFLLIIGSVLAVTIPTDGLSLWDFEDGSGTTITDIWNGNDGTQTGMSFSSTVPSYGISGDGGDYSGYFDGSANIEVPDYVESDDVSICLWIYFDSAVSQYIIDKRNGVSAGWFIYTYSGGGIQFGFKDGTRNLYAYNNGGDFTEVDTWYNFCVVKDGDTVELYKNGVDTNSGETESGFTSYANTQTLDIGSNYLQGYIDDFKIIDKALNTTEIQNNYNYGNICGASGCGVEPTAYFDITNTNEIIDMTAYFNSTSYSTTNGTINTGIESSEEFNLIMESNEGYYFNNTYTDYNISNDLETTFIAFPTVIIYDIWDNSALSSFNVTYDTTTIDDITGTAYIPLNESKSITISKDNYFPKTLTHDFTDSNDLNTSMVQSEINFTLEEYFTNISISDWTLFNGVDELYNTSTSYAIMNLPAGTYDNLSIVSNSGTFADKYPDSFTVSALDNKTITRQIYVYDMNFTANYIVTNATISNFTIYLSSYNRSDIRNITTTNGYAVLGGVVGDKYNITIDATDYALQDNQYNLTLTNHTNYRFNLYTENSVQFNLYDEETSILISTKTMIITLTGNATSYIFNTTTGTYYKDLIIDGTYSTKIESADGLYSPKYYSITVGGRSHQTLNAYLSSNYESAIFTFVDSTNYDVLENVLFTQSRIINGSWSVVSTKLSDITGRIPASYLSDVAYTITLTKSGYETKTFVLDPFLFSTYTVEVDRTVVISDSKGGVSISFNPKTFYKGNNTLTFTLTSPIGSLTGYWLNISYPSNYNYTSGNNSIGEVFERGFNITDPEIGDQVIIRYHYETSTGQNITKNNVYSIVHSNSWYGTFAKNKLETYELGQFERILIVVGVVIILAGFGFMIAGTGGSIFLMLIVYALAIVMGLIPFWAVVITFLMGMILIIKVGSR